MGVVRKGRWSALMVMLAILLTASLASGEDPPLCYEAYLTGGQAQEQMDFEAFREFHSDGVCAAGNRDA